MHSLTKNSGIQILDPKENPRKIAKYMYKQHISIIAHSLQITEKQVEATLKLLEEGATIPFLARYRKEMTGSLDEVVLASISDQSSRLKDLESRRETVLQTIEEQGKLTPALRDKILSTYNPTELEDLYLPYKPKRKTKAMIAREKGLEPLAKTLKLGADLSLSEVVKGHIARSGGKLTQEEALQGARDIIAEEISEDSKTRNLVRNEFRKSALVSVSVAKGKEEEGANYKDYFDFTEPLSKCPSHRFLAILRGVSEGILRISIAPEMESVVTALESTVLHKNLRSDFKEQLQIAARDSYKRLLQPSIETEFRQMNKEKADEEAISVFAKNLRQLLLASPLGEKRVLSLDPGFRTGCKLVCLDAEGNLIFNDTIYPHPPQNEVERSKFKIRELVKKFQIQAIAIGNGTASRETEDFVRSITFTESIEIFSVNESGASIYSASKAAREEFPDADVTVRGAVSIGRRLMDPLAELVKIEPKSIGVGQYQHDVDQGKLKKALDMVVESCVNSVGVNLNTASKHLLSYVSGVGPTLAENIVSYRKKNGKFKNRRELLKVPRLGEKAFEQCAGFLRIPNAENPLDNSAVHPESYTVVEKIARDLKTDIPTLLKEDSLRRKIKVQDYVTEDIGLPTLKDILNELAKPGRDPREKAKAFSFSGGIRSIEDLKEGMVLEGIVNNMTNFGAFVDLGIKESGLVHISQISEKFISSPSEVLHLSQVVKVKVVSIDLPRKRIQLTMKF